MSNEKPKPTRGHPDILQSDKNGSSDPLSHPAILPPGVKPPPMHFNEPPIGAPGTSAPRIPRELISVEEPTSYSEGNETSPPASPNFSANVKVKEPEQPKKLNSKSIGEIWAMNLSQREEYFLNMLKQGASPGTLGNKYGVSEKYLAALQEKLDKRK